MSFFSFGCDVVLFKWNSPFLHHCMTKFKERQKNCSAISQFVFNCWCHHIWEVKVRRLMSITCQSWEKQSFHCQQRITYASVWPKTEPSNQQQHQTEINWIHLNTNIHKYTHAPRFTVIAEYHWNSLLSLFSSKRLRHPPIKGGRHKRHVYLKSTD